MSKVISYANVQIAYNADTSGLKSHRSTLAAMTRELRQSESEGERFVRKLTDLNAATANGRRTQDEHNKLLARYVEQLYTAARAAGRHKEALRLVAAVAPEAAAQINALAAAESNASHNEAEVARVRALAEERRKAAAERKRLEDQAIRDAETANRVREQENRRYLAFIKERQRQEKVLVDAYLQNLFKEMDARDKAARQEQEAVRKQSSSIRELATVRNKAHGTFLQQMSQIRLAQMQQSVDGATINAALQNTIEAYVRSAKAAGNYAQAERDIAALAPQMLAQAQGIAAAYDLEQTFAQQAADQKKAQAKAQRDIDAQVRREREMASTLVRKAAGDVGLLNERETALYNTYGRNVMGSKDLRAGLSESSRLYFANAKSVKDVDAALSQLNTRNVQANGIYQRAAQNRRDEITAEEKRAQQRRNEVQEQRARTQAQAHVNQVIQQGQTIEERYNAQLILLKTNLNAGRISLQQFEAAQKSLNNTTQQQMDKQKGGSRLAQFGANFAVGLSPIGALSAAGLGVMAGAATLDFVKDSILAYSNLRQNLIKLEVVLGSTGAAFKTHNELRLLAVRANQASGTLMDAAVTMAQFGVANEKIVPSLTALSEISAGSKERLQALTLAFSQSAAAGRLTGQEVLQFVNAGWNPLAEIARTTGKSMKQLRKEMEAGALGFDVLTQAAKSATSEGGKFYQMNEKLSNELPAQLNRLSDAWLRLQEAVGSFAENNQVLDYLTSFVKLTTLMVNQLGRGDFLPGLAILESTLNMKLGIADARDFQRLIQARMEFETGKTFEQMKKEREEIKKAEAEAKKKAPEKQQAEQDAKRAKEEEERLKDLQRFADKMKERGLSDIQEYQNTIAQLTEAVSKNMITMAEAKQALNVERDKIRKDIVGDKSAAQQYADAIKKTAELTAANIITQKEANDYLNKTRDELNEKFLDRVKDIREELRTDAEKQMLMTRELAGLVFGGMLTLPEATEYLAKQMSDANKEISATLPTAMQAGSREAYEMMTKTREGMEQKQLNKLEEQRKIQEAQRVLLQQIATNPNIGIVN